MTDHEGEVQDQGSGGHRSAVSVWSLERGINDRFNPSIGHYQTEDDYLTIFCDADGAENFIEVHGPQQETNARMCFAAPNMLAALKLVQRTTYQMHEEAVAAVDAAIARAEGRS